MSYVRQGLGEGHTLTWKKKKKNESVRYTSTKIVVKIGQPFKIHMFCGSTVNLKSAEERSVSLQWELMRCDEEV